MTQKTVEDLRSQVSWTRSTSEELMRQMFREVVADLCTQGKNTINQDDGLEEQAQPTVETELSRKRNIAYLSTMCTVKRNHDSPLGRLCSTWELQSTVWCNAAGLWRSPDWRWNVEGNRHEKSRSMAFHTGFETTEKNWNPRIAHSLPSFDENFNEFVSSSSFLGRVSRTGPANKRSVHEPTPCERLEKDWARLELFLSGALPEFFA